MIIQRLEISQFRNLHQVKLKPSPSVNLLFGVNGSGKTSFLEAIYCLGLGRSFRTPLSDRVIEKGCDKFSIFANISDVSVGLEKTLQGKNRIKIAGDDVGSIAEITKLLPIQLINTDIYQLLNDGPKFRREFLDWGVFHVEPSFLSLWKSLYRILKQRNLGIKMRASRDEIQSWNVGLVEVGEKITLLRKKYLDHFKPIFARLLEKFACATDTVISYKQGWSEGEAFAVVLQKSLETDLRVGYTQYGPHRADIEICCAGGYVKDFLSRGQQKAFIYAMKLAQGLVLSQLVNKQCIYLIDDLPAELDSEKRKVLSETLKKIKAQVFVTGIERHELAELERQEDEFAKLFHVEQGKIIETENMTFLV